MPTSYLDRGVERVVAPVRIKAVQPAIGPPPPTICSGRHEMHTEHCTLPSACSVLRHSTVLNSLRTTSAPIRDGRHPWETRPPPPSDSLAHPRLLFAPKVPPLWSTTVRPAELSPSPVVGTFSEERSMPRRDLFKAQT